MWQNRTMYQIWKYNKKKLKRDYVKSKALNGMGVKQWESWKFEAAATLTHFKRAVIFSVTVCFVCVYVFVQRVLLLRQRHRSEEFSNEIAPFSKQAQKLFSISPTFIGSVTFYTWYSRTEYTQNLEGKKTPRQFVLERITEQKLYFSPPVISDIPTVKSSTE